MLGGLYVSLLYAHSQKKTYPNNYNKKTKLEKVKSMLEIKN